MVDIKRWYIYLLSAITVQAVTWALIALLRNILLPVASREAMAIQLAIILVALPAFIGHWLWAQRLAAGVPDERASFPRRLYLYGMLAAFLAPAISNLLGALRALTYALLGVQRTSPYSWETLPTNREELLFTVPAILVLAVLWTYHWRVKRADDQIVPESDASFVLRHLYDYGFAAAGLALTALATGTMLRWLLAQLLSGGTTLDPARLIFGSELVRLVLGLLLWLVFWLPAQQAFESSNDVRQRESVVRKAYLYLVVFVSALAAIITVSLLLADLLERALGVPPGEGDLSLALALITVSGVVWGYHAAVLRRDAAVAGELAQQALVRRIYVYLMAGLGLTAAIIGLVGTLAGLFEGLQRATFGTGQRQELAQSLAALIAGLPVWLWHWRRAQFSAAAEPPAGVMERRSFVRRFYLYLFIFFATLAVLGAIIYILSQFLMLLLGARRSAGLLYDVGEALAYALVAAGLLAYHVTVLREDSQALAAAEAAQRRSLTVAVIDAGDGSLGAALAARLQEKIPDVVLRSISLSSPSPDQTSADVPGNWPESTLSGVDLIVGPWLITVPDSRGGRVSLRLAAAVISHPAQKILFPEPEPGFTWAGVEKWRQEAMIEDVVAEVHALTLGEQSSGSRRLAPWAIVLIVLATIFLLVILVPMLISIVLEGLNF